MLRKLLKYEMSAMGRILLPLYGALLFMSLVMGIVVNILNTLPVFQAIVVFLYVAVAVGAAVMTVILIVQRFYKNLLGNEGYLMFSLPVSTGKHILNKAITSGTWMVIAIITGILSSLIIVSSTGELDFAGIAAGLGEIWRKVGGQSILYLIELIILVFLSATHSIFRIYAAISIGHLWGNHRVLGAILGFIGINIVEVLVVSLLDKMGIMFAVTGSFDELYRTVGEDLTVHAVFLALALLLVVLAGIYYAVIHYILKNKLNLE